MEQAKTNHRGGNRNRGIQEQTAIDCINLKTPWFEYAGDYCGIDAPVRVRCKKCGSELVRSMVTIRMGQATCSVCREAERNARRKAKQEAEAEERARKESERQAKRERARQENERREAEKLARRHPCVICGTVTTNKYCCSTRCSQRRHNQIKEVKRRAKLLNALVDADITLEALYERDGGVCYICGKHCDWTDRETIDGTVICGNSYPSIDHVVPLAKGGLHEWSNVKLAHRHCNSVKSDNIAPLGRANDN